MNEHTQTVTQISRQVGTFEGHAIDTLPTIPVEAVHASSAALRHEVQTPAWLTAENPPHVATGVYESPGWIKKGPVARLDTTASRRTIQSGDGSRQFRSPLSLR